MALYMSFFWAKQDIVYARLLPTPERSVFLFGPRGTGVTWIH